MKHGQTQQNQSQAQNKPALSRNIEKNNQQDWYVDENQILTVDDLRGKSESNDNELKVSETQTRTEPHQADTQEKEKGIKIYQPDPI